jgi:DNA adenine methylase
MEFLPYVGSKRRSVEQIVRLVPKGMSVCSPFLGSGHVEHALAEAGHKVCVYDAWDELVTLWNCCRRKTHRKKVSNILPKEMPKCKDTFYDIRDDLETNRGGSCCTRSAIFLGLNRSSFNNNCRTFGSKSLTVSLRGMSKIQEKIESFETKLKPVKKTFEESLPKHPKCLWFLDPPYYVKRGHYGYKGKLHAEFNHEKLRDLVVKHKGLWILTYNDHEYIREMYKGYRIEKLGDQALYRSNVTRDARHILITNIPLEK